MSARLTRPLSSPDSLSPEGSLSPGLVYRVSRTTRRTIGARVAGTPVHFLLAVGASEVGRAFTGVAGPLVALPAGTAIEARGVGTAQGAVLTVRAIVARGT